MTLVLAACSGQPAVLDLEGRPADPLRDAAGPVVLLFVRADCPISNRYAPEMRRLAERFGAAGVAFHLVYPDPAATAVAIREHRREFDLPLNALRDPDHLLVAATGAEVTPEAAVYDSAGRLVYRGRIDDRWLSFGRARRAATRRDLARVLAALERGETLTPTTTAAVGCYLDDLRPGAR